MPGKEAQKRVKAQSMGDDKGVNVYFGRKMLRKAGLDPDDEFEVARGVMRSDRRSGEIRCRFYPVEEEEGDE